MSLEEELPSRSFLVHSWYWKGICSTELALSWLALQTRAHPTSWYEHSGCKDFGCLGAPRSDFSYVLTLRDTDCIFGPVSTSRKPEWTSFLGNSRCSLGPCRCPTSESFSLVCLDTTLWVQVPLYLYFIYSNKGQEQQLSSKHLKVY